MTTQDLSDLQKHATNWWSTLLDPSQRVAFAKKYIGTSELKTLSHLEIMYCYLYFKEESK